LPSPDAFCNRIWLDAEYLLWWTKATGLPPLLTTGSATDPVPGALGQPATRILYGDSNVGGSDQSGGRFSAGYWFGNDRILGIDGSFFFLGQHDTNAGFASPGSPILTRPYFNTVTNKEAAYRLAFPGRREGEFDASVTERLWGAEANLRAALWRNGTTQIDLIGGFRYLNLHESLETGEDVFIGPGGLSQLATVDHFATSNNFYGGQIGAHATFIWHRFFMDVTVKVALGSTHESVTIDGAGLATGRFGLGTSLPYGTLALPSNLGNYDRNIFTVVPEARLNLGYQVTRRLRAYIGYTFLYTSRAVRPGDNIDLGVNPSVLTAVAGRGTLVGTARPLFPGKDSDFWAQGLDFGLEFRY
jgi:hypothetical protein